MTSPEKLDNSLSRLHFGLVETTSTSRLYLDREKAETAIIIDNKMFDDATPPFTYLEYTSWQNRLMHKYEKVYRFASNELSEIEQQINFFLSNQESPDELKMFGRDRHEQDIDPTRPEYVFESVFESVYGPSYLSALEREYEYFDLSGKRRFIDYLLSTCKKKIAIELNGESFHHPLFIKLNKYQSQLFKQNSLVKSGYPVFRWSLAGMNDEKKFADQMRSYFGASDTFQNIPHFKAVRKVSTFQLQEHQEEALDRIAKQRADGESTFLLVLPTGTGKTEVFIEDHKRQYAENRAHRTLVIVPSTELKSQTIERFRNRNPNLKVGELVDSQQLNVCVQTTAFMIRHYIKYDTKAFDYIVVDEAHHAPAQGLRRILEHFQPNTLIGVTATDGRLDQQSLSEIFGRYEVNLTLPQAIERGLLPPIRAVRLETNINFSEVRFNGKEFVKADLQKKVLLPSRDTLVVDLLKKYFDSGSNATFNQKQGVVFCVDIKHAERMAVLLNQQSISAAAVSGKNREAIEDYRQGNVRFLCSCDLLNEGWDAPQTSILVMARPTLSKVLYMQQLGRGTRSSPNKEALYVIDVVDSYGAALQPWSLHSLFNLKYYQPFQNVFNDNTKMTKELLILDQLWEGERKLVPLELFNYENEYGNLLNEEQLARELFISTGTVHSWIKKGDIKPHKTLPFGRKKLHYFKPEYIDNIRENKGLKERTESTRKDDFVEFLEKRDYTFSFKIVFLLAFFRLCDKQGESELSDLVELYANFYRSLHKKHGQCEKASSPLNKIHNLNNAKYMSKSLLENPFEKFERKRFMHHCKELSKLSFDTVLWEKLDAKLINAAIGALIKDLAEYYEKHLNIEVKENLLIHAGLLDSAWATNRDEPIKAGIGEGPFVDLNYYPDIRIACGQFKTGSHEEAETIQLGIGYGNISRDTHFLANAYGNSMDGGKNPIVDGDLLLLEFITPDSAGSLRGQTVVIEREEYGVNEYLLRQIHKQENGRYSLKAFNPEYGDMIADDTMKTRAKLIRNLGKRLSE
ncbi:MAG: DEAD/DEAH box helicase family protein [Hahellaceae bacterium]|jgi:superfamily II DNA or RNA helicase/phage repressor protein C with HTH and peptisase S24 domain|nr:DEAD/DEAH box helicase family protein [Hahellaceae bacterium]